MYAANVGLMPNDCMKTTNVSFVADGLGVDDCNINGADTNRARSGAALMEI